MSDIVELTEAECRAYLDGRGVGRLAFMTPAGLRLVPMSYATNPEVVVFVTRPGSELATHGEGAEAVFEIDDFDEATGRAWSVVAAGRLERPSAVDDDQWDIRGWRNPTPWVGDERWFHLQLRWSRLTGRRLG